MVSPGGRERQQKNEAKTEEEKTVAPVAQRIERRFPNSIWRFRIFPQKHRFAL
jgi:hypothetical protein